MRSVPAAAGMLTPSGRRTPLSPAAITRSAKDLSYQAGALVDTGTAQPPSNRSAPATGGAVDVEVVVEVVAARAGPASRARAVTAAATARIRVIRMAGHSTRKPQTVRQTTRRELAAQVCGFRRSVPPVREGRVASGADDGLRRLDRVRHAEVVVLLDDKVVRVDRAGRALGIAGHLEGAERLFVGVV